MHKILIDTNSDGQRADKFLRKYLPLAPQNLIYKLFRKKDVKLNGQRIDGSVRIHAGDVMEIFLYEDRVRAFQEQVEIRSLPIEFEVIYEDEHILVVNKPAGLILHEDEKEKRKTLANQVLAYLYAKGDYDPEHSQGFVPGPVHRLDRNTSGLVIFGKTFQALKDLNEMIRLRHCIEKKYLTILVGRLTDDQHLMGYMKKDETQQRCYMVPKETVGALTMETYLKVREYNAHYTLAEARLVTGRTHQIRLHCASIHHPVLGDRKYGDFKVNQEMKQRFHLNHQLLHAYHLQFKKTVGALRYLEGMTIEARPPESFMTIKRELFRK